MALVIALALAGLWVVQRFKQLDRLTQEVAQGYAGLEQNFRFSPPPEAAPLAEARIESYRKVRRALLQTVPPELDRYTSRLLAEGTIPTYEHAVVLNRFLDFLRVASAVHLEKLEAEQMSLREYAWIHGHRMSRIMTTENPERAAYEAALNDLDRILDAEVEAGAEFTPGDYVEELAEAYGGKGGIGEIAAEGEAAPSSLGRVLDLALASPRFMTFIDEIEKEAERR